MIKYSFLTNVGLVKSNNEDSIAIDKKVYSEGNFVKHSFKFGKKGAFAIFDGVGGSNYGEVASRECGKFFNKYFNSDTITDRNTLYNAIQLMNNNLVELKEKYNCDGMKTTVVGSLINKNQILFFNIGDSRAYLFEDNNLIRQSVDDTYRNKLIKERKYSLEEIDNMDTAHVITNCLGHNNFDKMKTHSFIIEKKRKQKIILMSDGISDLLEEDELIEILSNNKSKKTIFKLIEDIIIKRGAHDNYSLLIIEVK